MDPVRLAGSGAATPAPQLEQYRSNNTVLRALTQADLGWCQALMNDPRVAPHTRMRGATVGGNNINNVMWQGVTAQFAVAANDSGNSLGFVTLYRADFRAVHAYLSVVMRPETHADGRSVEGIILFVDYCFTVFSLRKLYLEATEANLATFAGVASRLFRTEGRLVDYEIVNGSFVDVLIMSMDRTLWSKRRRAFLNAIGSTLETP